MLFKGEGQWRAPDGFPTDKKPVYFDTYGGGKCFVWPQNPAAYIKDQGVTGWVCLLSPLRARSFF